jgi:hypothetical protein
MPVSLDCPFLIVPSVFSNIYQAGVFFLKEKKIQILFSLEVEYYNNTGLYLVVLGFL